METQTMSEVERQLRDAAEIRAGGRLAAPAVYAEYLAYLATGNYPYTAQVATWIAGRNGFTVLPYHAAPGWGEGDDLTKKLHTELYYCGAQHRLSEQVAQEVELASQGFRPITELVPKEGTKVRFPNGTTYRLKPAGNGDWSLLAPGKRTNGVSLDGLVHQHRAYEKAKVDGYQSMNNPVVRMYAEAGR